MTYGYLARGFYGLRRRLFRLLGRCWYSDAMGLQWLERLFDRHTREKARRSRHPLIVDGHSSQANYPRKGAVGASYENPVVWTCDACGLSTSIDRIECHRNGENSPWQRQAGRYKRFSTKYRAYGRRLFWKKRSVIEANG